MKKNIIITVSVLILIVLLEVLISTKTKDKEKEFDAKEASVLVDTYFTDNYIVSSNIFKDGISERYKLGLAINNLDKELTEYNCSDLYPDFELDEEGIVVGNGTYCDGTVKGISYDDLNKSYKKLFGNDSKLKKESVGIYGYVESKDIFVGLSCRCGGVDFNKYLYKVKDAKEKGNNLTVNVYYYEYKPEEGKETEEIDEAKVLEENIDKASIYEVKFKKEDKVFKLVSVKKVS